jgi:hypothetical protein
MSSTTAALLGVLIGQFGGWVGTWITAKAESRRQRARLGLEAGIKEWEVHLAGAKASSRLGPLPVAPLLAYVHTNGAMLELIEGGDLNPETMRKVFAERDSILKALYADNRKDDSSGGKP